MRTKKSLLNIISNITLDFLGLILTFVVRTIFIKYLGSHYLGLNGLLTNVLSMLSIVELGFGTAITFSLYKPLAIKDKTKISALMSFYKKVYFYIGIAILILGTGLSFSLKFLVKDYALFPNIKIIYFIYLLNTVFWYFISYKEVLIIADQNNYKLSKINFLFKFLASAVEIAILFIFKDYILYLVSQIAITLLQRILINRYITKLYPDINFNSKEKLSNEESALIKKNVKATMFHKIGKYLINGTDNIILSAALSISIVGLYSNYLLIITTLDRFISTIFNSVVSSIGNLLAISDDEEKKYRVFKISNFVAYVIYGFSALTLYFVFNSFITIWVGKEYIFNNSIVLIIVFNFLFNGMAYPLTSFKSAAGVYDQDKYIPIAQSVVNLVVSIILVKSMGITGVLLGTLISILVLPIWNKPYIVCKYVFNRSVKEYYLKYIKYLFVILLDGLLLNVIFKYMALGPSLLNIILTSAIIFTLFILSIILLFSRDDEFKFLINSLSKFWRRIWKKK